MFHDNINYIERVPYSPERVPYYQKKYNIFLRVTYIDNVLICFLIKFSNLLFY